MGITRKFWITTLLLITVVITSIIIGIKKYMPESKAEEKNTKTIQVTYKAGIGTGEDVTVNQTVCDSQTQGTNDYTDGKIVLYRNGKNGLNFSAEQVEYNGTMYDRILTGWKLISVMKNGTEITNFIEPENQNYADKTNANKDIDTVYAQEGWYIVPDGVTAITVEAVYARAIYVRSPFDKMYYDEVHCFYYGENSDGTTTLEGTAVAKSSDDNDGSTVEKAVSTLRRAYELMSENNIQTVYDTAFVLCGDTYEINYVKGYGEYATGTVGTYTNYSSEYFGYNSSKIKPVTITSIKGKLYENTALYDFLFCSSYRYDNICVSSLSNDSIKKIHLELNVNVNTYQKGGNYRFDANSNMIFEATETVIKERTTIFYLNVKAVNLMGGIWTVAQNYDVKNTTLSKFSYIKAGGVSHINMITTSGWTSCNTEQYVVNPVTIIITGGQLGGIYGTGYGYGGSIKGDVNIFVSGGKIADIYGGGNGSVYPNEDENGDVNIEITGGIFGNIYGGGKYYTSRVSGNINIKISSAIINENVYGGGKGGEILGNVIIDIKESKIKGNVFGGGLGQEAN